MGLGLERGGRGWKGLAEAQNKSAELGVHWLAAAVPAFPSTRSSVRQRRLVLECCCASSEFQVVCRSCILLTSKAQ